MTPDAQPEPRSPQPLHAARQLAESFGADPAGYDRVRPSYPDQLIARIIAASPGPDVLDVGCGSGIAARQLQAAGCTVLGIEPDARMAEFAQAHGLAVEISRFETWDAAGRTFDAVTAAQSWHWVDPAAGAQKAADVLRPGGLLAIFGHVFEPPLEVAEPLAATLRRVLPDSPFANMPATRPLATYESLYARVGESLRATGRFLEPAVWRFDWQRLYTRDEWLALLPTTGGLTRVPEAPLAEILTAVGDAIDELGGAFTMEYVTLATVATVAAPD